MPTLTQANYEAIRDHLFDRIHKTGEQVKNDFPNVLRWAIETEAWTHFTDASGRPFTNLVEWLHATYPNGPAMGQGQHTLTYEDALQLTEGAQDVQRVLAQYAPAQERTLTQSEREELERFRAALAVQLHRGWHAVRDKHTGLWKVGEFCGVGDFLRFIRAHRFPDPVSAILEAERFYVEHVHPNGNPQTRSVSRMPCPENHRD